MTRPWGGTSERAPKSNTLLVILKRKDSMFAAYEEMISGQFIR